MMTSLRSKTMTALALALAASLLATPALAQKPDWAGGGKPDREQGVGSERGPAAKSERRDNDRQRVDSRDRARNDDRRQSAERDGNHGRDERYGRDAPLRAGAYFTERHREVVHSYYAERFRAGHCPPGLAMKRNGCMPPGLAKKWRIGHPLPRGVAYYDAPRDIVLRFGMPPEGHRYVRVAADILLIAVGTSIVVDAIEDLSRM